jgi:hypothetical protein
MAMSARIRPVSAGSARLRAVVAGAILLAMAASSVAGSPPTRAANANAAAQGLRPVAVTASAHDGPHVPGHTLDGDLATRWSADGDGAWIRYELDAPRRLDAVDIAWHDGDRRVARFTVEVAVDGGTWQRIERVHTGTTSGRTRGAERVALPGVEARALRIIGHGNTVNSWTSITAVVIHAEGATPGPPLPPPPAAPLPSRSVLWSTDFGGASPKAALRVEVEDSPGNLSFPRPAHALDGAVYRARVVAGQRNGHKWRTRFADVPGARGNHLGIGEQSEARLRYRVWVPGDSSVDAVDMKLPGIAGLPPQQTGWQTATGGDQRTDSWSLRIHTRHPRASHFGQPRPQRFLDAYLYAQSAGGKRIGDHRFGMSFPLTDTTRESGRSLRFDLDRWNEIELRVRMNSRGRADGIVEVWLNGVKGVALTDVRFTVDDAVGINQLIAETFYNAPGATRDHAIDIARMAITTS